MTTQPHDATAARATRIGSSGFLLAHGLSAHGVGAGVVFITLTPMSERLTRREATKRWLRDFSNVPGSIFEKLALADLTVRAYQSPSLTLVASPEIQCTECDLRRPSDAEGSTRACSAWNITQVCPSCERVTIWQLAAPEHAFPCGWGTLFSPDVGIDRDWFRENKEAVAHLGIYVFESEDFGILLGIDAGGFDFFDAYWMPLYDLRGLRWHEE